MARTFVYSSPAQGLVLTANSGRITTSPPIPMNGAGILIKANAGGGVDVVNGSPKKTLNSTLPTINGSRSFNVIINDNDKTVYIVGVDDTGTFITNGNNGWSVANGEEIQIALVKGGSHQIIVRYYK
jgi:hypothetical protein